MREWKAEGFLLKMWDTNRNDRRGQSYIRYQFWHKNELVFKGEDFLPSPMHSIDGDEAVAALLGFLSLRPGDTDKEYFDSYTERQLEWAKAHREELSLLQSELEESLRDEE